MNRTIVDNKQFAKTVKPIIQDKEVQTALANEITDKIFAKVDVSQELKNNLPENIQFVTGPLTDQIEGFTNKTVQKVVSSPKATTAWNNIVTTTHDVVIGYIKNPNSTGQITVDQVYDAASKELKDSPIGFLFGKNLPDSVGKVTVKDIKWFPQARAYLDALRKVNLGLLLATVVFTGIAVALSKNKKRLLITMSAYIFVFMLATLLAIQILISQGSLQVAERFQPAMHSIIKIITQPLYDQTLSVAGLAGSVLIFAFFASKFKAAVNLRKWYRSVNDYIFSKIFKSKVGKGSPKWLVSYSKQRLVILWTLIGALYALLAFSVPLDINKVLTAFTVSVVVTFVLEIIYSINRVLAKNK